MSSRPKQVGNLTYEQKKKIREWHDANVAPTQSPLADKAKCEFGLKAPRTRELVFPEVDEALANWVLLCQAKRVMLSDDLIKGRASQFATLSGIPDDQLLSFSSVWLQAFQGRHGFKQLSAHGENDSVKSEKITAQHDANRERLKGIPVADIYKIDEKGLLYHLEPNRNIAQRQVEGSKKSKTRVTVALICNANGSEKREPFDIDHVKKLRCFQKKVRDQLGFYYRSNLKAWMTGFLFREWMCELDNDMRTQKRNSVYLLDNSSAHTAYGMELNSVKDVWIIASFKRRYWHRQLEYALDLEEQGSQANIYMLDQLTAMKWIKYRWREVPSDAILNGFRDKGLVLGRTTTCRSRIDADDQLNTILLAQLHQPRVRNPMDLNDLVCCTAEADTEMEAFSVTALLSEGAGARFLSTTQETSDFTVSELTSEGVINTQPEISAEGKVDTARAIIFLLGDHPDL
uniref:Uncharacterized protein AlNc14C145G7376 n=1 Tax=Albugo laibachii Nc14 TaxID=890382 RepID=F0WLI9_9STRA|nr:hypothetical protein TRIADDRAFT_5525 [Albugo laibachii Nc14]|eukprot:CCA22152.1 hypothetical protein TRIADDRAFT_5525 [Albugo laibachii Nc14]